MRVKLILPALTEARSPYWRPLKYSLFPPLGLATLAGYLAETDEITLEDEHVERVTLDDDPELVAIQVYITSARRAYELADHYRRRGAHVALGGPHVTALPEEAARYADSVFLGPGEDTWPAFLEDFRAGRARARYQSTVRDLTDQPPPRRDLLKTHLYLVRNPIVVSRGCPYGCDFCYVRSFYEGGACYYRQPLEAAVREIERLPGRHLYFLDDNLFGHKGFALALLERMRGMGRLWQAAGTVDAVLTPGLIERAVASGLRSLFVGFESLDDATLASHNKRHNPAGRFSEAIRLLHDNGVMVNGSFVFGADTDGPGVFDRTVEWAVAQGIETATFHVLTPYPGTGLHERLAREGRITSTDWDLYDTRHAVFTPARMSAGALEEGYRRAYREFYRWSAVLEAAATKPSLAGKARHLAFTAGWRKLEWLWAPIIRTGRLGAMRGALERVLAAGHACEGVRAVRLEAEGGEVS
jgi:radical SAM superfamily enzyme YgiQ (UPF0313 family)